MPSICVLRVALATPLRRLFDYLPPAEMPREQVLKLPIGARVSVPFGGQGLLVGLLMAVDTHTEVPVHKLKTINALLDDAPILPAPTLKLCEWAAHYYHHALGEVMHAALPIGLRKGNGLPPAPVVWQHTPEGKGLGANALKRSPNNRPCIGYYCSRAMCRNTT